MPASLTCLGWYHSSLLLDECLFDINCRHVSIPVILHLYKRPERNDSNEFFCQKVERKVTLHTLPTFLILKYDYSCSARKIKAEQECYSIHYCVSTDVNKNMFQYSQFPRGHHEHYDHRTLVTIFSDFVISLREKWQAGVLSELGTQKRPSKCCDSSSRPRY